jgi:2-octaprenyl-6-methoxyphenol hydroxylase
MTLPASADALAVEPRDIAIVGGGPVGLALAAQLLRTTSWRITLIDAATPARAARDPRAIALSHGSRQLLEQIGAWPVPAQAIEHIHVSQRGRFGHVKLHGDDYGVPALGYVVRYGDLCQTLERALARAADAARAGERAFETRIDNIDQDDRSDAALVRLTGTSHAEHEGLPVAFAARIAVQAEGGLFHQQIQRLSRGTEAARRRDYQQTAIIGHVTCTQPQPGWAWERFTEEGPLALLPHEEHGVQGYALVWCCAPEQAMRRLALPRTSSHMSWARRSVREWAGSRWLASATRSRSGSMPRRSRSTGALPRSAMPRRRCIRWPARAEPGPARRVRAGRSLRAGCTPQALEAFASRHRVDRAMTIGITDLLPRVFAGRPDGGPCAWRVARGTGLRGAAQARVGAADDVRRTRLVDIAARRSRRPLTGPSS